MTEEPPHSTERFPAGYDYSARFPSLREMGGGEGGTVYTTDEPDGFYTIADEGALLDFVDDEEEPLLITIRRFQTADARDAYCATRYRLRLRNMWPARSPTITGRTLSLRVIAQQGSNIFLIGDDPNSRTGYYVVDGIVHPASIISHLARGYWDAPTISPDEAEHLLGLVRAAEAGPHARGPWS